MTKKFLSFSLFCLVFFGGFSQNIQYAREVIDSLTSEKMHGRGYVLKGDSIAANYVGKEFQKNHLKHFGESYFQKFHISINSFPEKAEIQIGKTKLIPGIDFSVFAASPSISGSFKLAWINKSVLEDETQIKNLTNSNLKNKILVVDKSGIVDKKILEVLDGLRFTNIFKARAIIFLTNKKIMGSVSGGQKLAEFPVFDLKDSLINQKTKKIKIDLKNKFFPNYSTQNVIGYIEGKEQPDSFIVFSGHYDHLGMLGKNTFFPGANDNASGISMMLNLAEYFSKDENKPKYSMAFMAFSSEEVGILGSKYYSENPLFPLNKIKFLINIDMVGSGEDGVTLVNSTVFDKEYNLLNSINDEKKYLKKINKRGEAANSDHYFFYKNGVKCFFIYSNGAYSEYHNPMDKSSALPLNAFENIFKILRDFVQVY
ncbi:MAG: M28 family peptidase [Bacteroidetes bacterium]|nr:M28 family peptidase [Bacteroidota bacterium]